MSNQRRIPIRNIYFLLCYALEIIEERDFRLSDPEDCDTQQELLARLIEKEVERQLKQGLYCTYQNRYEDLPTVRGRIVMSSTIQNLCSCTHKIGCNFDELSINNIYYKYHYPELLPTVSQVRWDLTDNTWSGYLPTMQTDAVLTGVSKLIIDAKYYKKAYQYNFGTPKFNSNNMYQIYTYVKNESGSSDRDVAGMLLYARTQDEPKLQEAFCLGGNWFYVRTLDLDLSPADIRSQLDDIAKLASTSQCSVA